MGSVVWVEKTWAGENNWAPRMACAGWGGVGWGRVGGGCTLKADGHTTAPPRCPIPPMRPPAAEVLAPTRSMLMVEVLVLRMASLRLSGTNDGRRMGSSQHAAAWGAANPAVNEVSFQAKAEVSKTGLVQPSPPKCTKKSKSDASSHLRQAFSRSAKMFCFSPTSSIAASITMSTLPKSE